jgi:hypothetical protein
MVKEFALQTSRKSWISSSDESKLQSHAMRIPVKRVRIMNHHAKEAKVFIFLRMYHLL